MRRALAAMTLAAVVVAGAVLVHSGRSSPAQHGGSSALAARSAVTVAAQPPAGDGSRLAAMDAVALTGEVLAAGFISRRDLIGSFTTPSFGRTLADETSTQVTALLFELGDRGGDPTELTAIEQPITGHVLTETPDTAVVAVWSVLVVAARGAGPARQVWRTVTLDMVRDGQRWLVDGWVSAIGPTPAPAPEVVVSDVSDIATVLGWAGAGEG